MTSHWPRKRRAAGTRAVASRMLSPRRGPGDIRAPEAGRWQDAARLFVSLPGSPGPAGSPAVGEVGGLQVKGIQGANL